MDYLENHLSPRIDITRQDIEMLYGEDIFDNAPGVTKQLNSPKRTRKNRLVENAGRSKRTVELMPIGGRLTQEEKRDLAAITDSYPDMEEEPAYEQGISSVTEEELEALLKDFLAT